MPILGASNLAANKDMMAKIWTKFNRDTILYSSRKKKNVGKGEIVRYDQFLLFPQCFKKHSVVDVLKRESME